MTDRRSARMATSLRITTAGYRITSSSITTSEGGGSASAPPAATTSCCLKRTEIFCPCRSMNRPSAVASRRRMPTASGDPAPAPLPPHPAHKASTLDPVREERRQRAQGRPRSRMQIEHIERSRRPSNQPDTASDTSEFFARLSAAVSVRSCNAVDRKKHVPSHQSRKGSGRNRRRRSQHPTRAPTSKDRRPPACHRLGADEYPPSRTAHRRPRPWAADSRSVRIASPIARMRDLGTAASTDRLRPAPCAVA